MTLDRTILQLRVLVARYRWPLMLVALAGLALLIDMPVARYCRAHPTLGTNGVPRDLRKILALAEVFAHGLGATAILITVLVLDERRRTEWLRLVAASLGAGLTADVIKWVVVARYRPSAANLEGMVSDTFITLWPLWSEFFANRDFRSSFQSCPSAHSAVAAGLAATLANHYPRGRWWFATLAALAMLQRIDVGAHFPSDTLLGAALGTAIAIALQSRLSPG
jgi:membrane-associated phospholipid phosphatase